MNIHGSREKQGLDKVLGIAQRSSSDVWQPGELIKKGSGDVIR